MQPWEKGSRCRPSMLYGPGQPCRAEGAHILGTLPNVDRMHCYSTWCFKLLCSKIGKANKPVSHMVTLPVCDTPIVNTVSFTLTLLSLCTRSARCFLHALLLTNLLNMLGYLVYIMISTYIVFISKRFLNMVLPVNNWDISHTCVIRSRFSVQHVHWPQALGQTCWEARSSLSTNHHRQNDVRFFFKRNWIKQNSLYWHLFFKDLE